MICFPNCKINIGLFVTEKREDGYHNLETVFYPLGNAVPFAARPSEQQVLNDVLEIVPAKTKTKLRLSGLPVAGDTSDNIVWKAYHLLLRDFPDSIPPLDIYLHKATPMGAGLGGGSADGAYMLSLLNNYCSLELTETTLIAYALQLGSDCPFFIRNTPQYATGRGEHMTPIDLDLSRYEIKVVCADVHVSTKTAFSRILPKPAPFDLSKVGTLPITEWQHHIHNDFEASVFEAHPQLADTKQQLYEQGAVYASLTGTGSAVYGIFEKEN